MNIFQATPGVQLNATIKTSLVGASLLLSACSGNYSGGPAPDGGSGPGTPGAPSKTVQEFFGKSVKTNMNFCRTCHVPDGVADTDEGKLFMLSANSSEDYDNVYKSWIALDKGVETNKILTNPSDPAQHHSGGQPWPVGSQPYNAMKVVLGCWDNPDNCAALLAAGTTTPVTSEFPLLGSARGGHLWDDFCVDKPDNTVLPDDPRTLVVPGVNKNKAVYMNAWWQTCQEGNKPANCGEQRARVARGYPIVASAGQVGAGSFFSGSSSTSSYSFPAADYAGMWDSVLSMSARPDNFDDLIAQRWGMPLSPTRNPYPLAGEDPNKTNGGSGQLPMGVTQLRKADGSWTGNLNVTCSICHGGGIGSASDGPGLGSVYGTNSLSDITLMFTDLSRLAPQQSALAIIAQNKVRGTGNITNFQLFGLLTISEITTIPGYLSIQTQPSTGTEDPPVWWNVGHRSAKFFDAGQVTDAKRIELSFHFPNTPFHTDMAADKKWILDHQQDSDAWIASQKSPAWPENKLGKINTALAEQGAILFHSKDLWSPTLKNTVPKPPGGNGSCASCHGAYSPRYVNDTAYLDTPALEGIAANVVPIDVIDTDRRRLDGNSAMVATYARQDWFAYSDGEKNADGVPLCGDWNDKSLRGDRELGYLAPPLYGVWATAPYFHNGAVPTAWDVLKPSDRHSIWRRWSNTARPDQTSQVMGFRYDLAAYDNQNLGWKYDALACGVTGTTPYIDCNPADAAPTIQDFLNLIYANGGLVWNLANLPILTNAQAEDRKIYNTRMYSQDNGGHEFTSVLTDQERKALIEYMKTL
ncbi:rubber dioxygenase RoxB [Stenotrophobium rhamnosiphilum]|uniref:Cytochrome c domain-containing protein n=1 Tax=Stenotrophobium rhamnosiphilum TaxID=2029166 RepID=A0A2T5MIP6_9GAMM|nr:hypothetical protein [Stenotrophobium rhamnosiphilum]PTU32445.1 hypothetical protein CJD38_07300 [Stenotrophobium rhamnosiphilum]